MKKLAKKYILPLPERLFGFLVGKELQSLYLLAPIIFALGVITYFSISFEPNFIFSLIIFVAAAFLCFAAYKFRKLFLLSLFLAFFAGGFFFADMRGITSRSVVVEEDLGTIWVRADIKDISRKEKDVTLVLKNVDLWQPEIKSFPPERTPEKIRVTVKTKIDEGLRVGDRVAFKAILSPPNKRPVLPDGYDFGKIAYFQKIGAIGYAISPVKLFEKKKASFIDRYQDYFYEKVKTNISDPDLAGIIVSQITADRVELSDETKKNMQNAGLGHLIAISGLNMSVAMVWMFFLFRSLFALSPRLALKYDTKKISVFFCIFFGLLYLLITGMPVSAVRAYLMVLLFFIAILFDRFSLSLHPVAFAALAILIVAPEQIMFPSFQLSFAAVIGLIGMYELYERYFRLELNRDKSFIRKWLLGFFGVVGSTLIASLVTAPFGILHFGTFQNYGVISNMIGVPVVSTLVLPFAFLSMLAMPLGIEAPFLRVAEFGANIIRNTSAYISHKEHSVTYMADLPNGFIAFVAIGFLILFIFKTRIRFVGIPIVLVGYYMLTIKPLTPDVVVNETGSLIALKQDDGSYKYLGSSRKSFAQYQFNSKLGVEKPEFIKDDESCNRNRCVYKNILFGKQLTKDDCGKYEYIFYLGKETIGCGIDKAELKAKGSHIIYGGNRLVTAAEGHSSRIWN